jgi:uncharacterized short protein YbdD (DUF466 family)
LREEFIKQGLSQPCQYCLAQHGTSVTFCDHSGYVIHVQKNHPKKPVYPTDEDLDPEKVEYEYAKTLRKLRKQHVTIDLNRQKYHSMPYYNIKTGTTVW